VCAEMPKILGRAESIALTTITALNTELPVPLRPIAVPALGTWCQGLSSQRPTSIACMSSTFQPVSIKPRSTPARRLRPALRDNDNFVSCKPMNRPELLLGNGHVIICVGITSRLARYFRLVLSYDALTLAQEAVYNDDPNAPGDSGGLGADICQREVTGNVFPVL